MCYKISRLTGRHSLYVECRPAKQRKKIKFSSSVHYLENEGKCGVCGDPWHEEQPRENEHGGKYGNGVIGRRYVMGQVREGYYTETASFIHHLGDFIGEWNGEENMI